jgi:hypothetical protein
LNKIAAVQFHDSDSRIGVTDYSNGKNACH